MCMQVLVGLAVRVFVGFSLLNFVSVFLIWTQNFCGFMFYKIVGL